MCLFHLQDNSEGNSEESGEKSEVSLLTLTNPHMHMRSSSVSHSVSHIDRATQTLDHRSLILLPLSLICRMNQKEM